MKIIKNMGPDPVVVEYKLLGAFISKTIQTGDEIHLPDRVEDLISRSSTNRSCDVRFTETGGG